MWLQKHDRLLPFLAQLIFSLSNTFKSTIFICVFVRSNILQESVRNQVTSAPAQAIWKDNLDDLPPVTFPNLRNPASAAVTSSKRRPIQNIERIEDIFTDIRPASAAWPSATTTPRPLILSKDKTKDKSNGDVTAEKVLLFLPDSWDKEGDLKASAGLVTSGVSTPGLWNRGGSTQAPPEVRRLVQTWDSGSTRVPSWENRVTQASKNSIDDLSAQAPWAASLSNSLSSQHLQVSLLSTFVKMSFFLVFFAIF
jgi:hypothetical protein